MMFDSKNLKNVQKRKGLKPKENETSHKSEIEQVERNRGMHVEIGLPQGKVEYLVR